MTELPDLWDEDAVVKWLTKELEDALLDLLEQREVRHDSDGLHSITTVIVGVIDPYQSGLT